jgi:hypothetical protein
MPVPSYSASAVATQNICKGASATFSVPLTWSTPPDSVSVVASAGATCSVAASTLTCTVSAEGASVKLTAGYGGGARAWMGSRLVRFAMGLRVRHWFRSLSLSATTSPPSLMQPLSTLPAHATPHATPLHPTAAADACSTSVPVSLPVSVDAGVTLVSVAGTPASVCPAPSPTGTLAFQVTTSNAASITAVLVSSSTLAAIPGASCSAAGGPTAWTVTCTNVPPTTATLNVTATSSRGAHRCAHPCRPTAPLAPPDPPGHRKPAVCLDP